MLAFFRRQNGRAFFPSLPIAALLPRSWRWADSTNDGWNVTLQLGGHRSTEKQAGMSAYAWQCAYLNEDAWDASLRFEYFCNTKGQRDFKSTLAFLASRRACCPTAVFSIQLTRNPHQTGEPRGPLPSGGNSAAKPHVALCPCAPAPRRVQGFSPARPATREARRRAAVTP